MKNKIIHLSFLWLLCIGTQAQSIDLQFIEHPINACGEAQFCGIIQLRGNNGADYLGISSIRLEYDPTVVIIGGDQNNTSPGSITPLNFDSSIVGPECPGFAPYAPIFYDASFPGDILMTVILNQPSIGNVVFACPNIENNWIDVATVCFDLIDVDGNPNIQFVGDQNGPPVSTDGCNFRPDTNDPNNIYSNGTFTGYSNTLTEYCNVEPGITLRSLVALQGALLGNDGGTVMRDDLRAQGLVPQLEPYSNLPDFTQVGQGGGETVGNVLLAADGLGAPVDWLLMEVRDPNNPANVIATQSVLVRRNNRIINSSGGIDIEFEDVPQGEYYISIRHRNHNGVMTAVPISFTDQFALVNFTDPNLDTWGTNATVNINGIEAMWSGATDNDQQVIFQGNNNDTGNVFFEVAFADDNPQASINHIVESVYSRNDLNMDGNVIYQGNENEPNLLFFNTLTHPENGSNLGNFFFIEQIP